MTTQEFRDAFLTEHKRDKKLTILNYLMIATLVVILLGVVWYFKDIVLTALSGSRNIFEGEYGWYYKLAFGGLAVGYIGFLISRIVTLNKRPQKIENLLIDIDNNKLATNIDEYVEHRIILYLGKITLKLCPVSYVQIYVEDNLNLYKLPLNSYYVPKLKKALSGINVADVNNAWNDLYTENEDEANGVFEETPIKSVDEFKAYMNEELSSEIESVDKSRKNQRLVSTICIVLGVLFAVGIMGYSQYTAFTGGFDNSFGMKMLIVMVSICVIFYIGYFAFIRPKQLKSMREGNTTLSGGSSSFAFKTQIFKKILKFASPEAQYVIHGHVGIAEFLESGLFVDKNYGITGGDLIIGRHNRVPYQFCDLSVTHARNFTKENEGPDSVFYGQFFVARFNKTFSLPIYIEPRKGIGSSFFSNQIGSYASFSGEKVELEDPEFMKMFNVYASDQIEARYILTPSLMERIKKMVKRTKGEYYISFRNNKITVLNNSGKNNFELKASKSLTKDDNQMIVDFYEEICTQFAVIDDLKLNVRIWG